MPLYGCVDILRDIGVQQQMVEVSVQKRICGLLGFRRFILDTAQPSADWPYRGIAAVLSKSKPGCSAYLQV